MWCIDARGSINNGVLQCFVAISTKQVLLATSDITYFQPLWQKHRTAYFVERQRKGSELYHRRRHHYQMNFQFIRLEYIFVTVRHRIARYHSLRLITVGNACGLEGSAARRQSCSAPDELLRRPLPLGHPAAWEPKWRFHTDPCLQSHHPPFVAATRCPMKLRLAAFVEVMLNQQGQTTHEPTHASTRARSNTGPKEQCNSLSLSLWQV